MSELDEARARLLAVLHAISTSEVLHTGLTAVILEMVIGRDLAVFGLRRTTRTRLVGASRLDGKADLYRPRGGSR